MKQRTHPDFNTWEWRTYSDHKAMELEQFIKDHKGAEFYVGTDSQNRPKKKACVFTSALIGPEMSFASTATIRFATPRPLALGDTVHESSHTPSSRSARTVPTGSPFS